MKIFDCTLYYDEDLILDLRLNILNKYVDKFVICESKFSHSGREKKLNFDINKFKDFKNKIIYLVADDEPKGLLYSKELNKKKENTENFRFNSIKRIGHQRNKLKEGLSHANDEDLILYSDNDEIPYMDNFDITKFNKKIVIFKQKLFYYKFNLLCDRIFWYGTKGCKKKYLNTFEELRQIKAKKYPFYRLDTLLKKDKEISLEIIENGGWHFTRIQSPEDIHIKELDAEHHDEYRASGKNAERIKDLINRKVIDHDHHAKTEDSKYKNEFKLKTISMNEMPLFLSENTSKYKDWIDFD